MIQSVLQDDILFEDIRSARLDPGEVCIWWMGQSGYVIKTASALWVVDPYLSDALTVKYAATEKPHIRMTAIPLRPGLMTLAQLVTVSHGHTDHFDRETLAPLLAASAQAPLLLPAVLVERALGFGISRERLIPVSGDGDTVTAGALTIHAIPSAHPVIERDPALGQHFIGCVFQVDGLTIYHSGDTIVYDGLAERLAAFRPDVLFLPINGRTMHGGAPVVAGNMNAREAVALRQAVGSGVVIPHHYDMFTFNTADVGAFIDLARDARVPYAVLRPGGLWRFRRDAQP